MLICIFSIILIFISIVILFLELIVFESSIRKNWSEYAFTSINISISILIVFSLFIYSLYYDD